MTIEKHFAVMQIEYPAQIALHFSCSTIMLATITNAAVVNQQTI